MLDAYAGEGGGFACQQDGVNQSCDTVFSVLAGGGAGLCPNNNCGIGTGSTYQCQDVVCGYFSNQYVATHENELNGLLLTNSQYGQYLQGIMEGQRGAIVDQLTQAVCAPGDATCAATINSGVTLNTSIGNNGLQGGNYNFTLSANVQSMIDLSGCIDMRCGTFDTLDFSHGVGNVHMDTANPYSLWGIGAIVHVFVDLFLGNTIWSGGIPR
jgi:hypothetical protein